MLLIVSKDEDGACGEREGNSNENRTEEGGELGLRDPLASHRLSGGGGERVVFVRSCTKGLAFEKL